MKEKKYYPRPFFTIRSTDFQKKNYRYFFGARLLIIGVFFTMAEEENERFITFVSQIFSWFVLVKANGLQY